MHSLGNGTEGFEKAVHDSCRIEFFGGDCLHGWSVNGLGVFDRLHEDCQSPHVFVRFRTLTSGRQPILDDTRFPSPYEESSGPHANSRTARKEDFLKSQRRVIVVGQVLPGS